MHDKIEFELFETCYDFNSKNRLNFPNYKDKKQYLNSLLKLTNNILSGKLMNDDINLLKKLDGKIFLNLKKIKPNSRDIFFDTLLQNLWNIAFCWSSSLCIYIY